ncbi:MAG: DUF4843 domain-containing protein [Marinifilaceae bacterium]
MNKILYWTILTVGVLVSCQTEEIDVFDAEDNGIYFQRVATTSPGSTNVIYTDSLTFTFAGAAASKKYSVYSAPVVTMGKVRDYDRKFKIVVDEESNAIRGTHYDIDVDTLLIKAGNSKGTVPVKFYRTDDLLTSTMRLKLRLEENEHFKFTIQDYKASNNWQQNSGTLSGLTWVFRFNEQYTQSFFYRTVAYKYLGPWSPKKFMLLNDLMGWTNADWNKGVQAGAKITAGRLEFVTKEFKKYLQQMADDGTPITDIDGSYMQLPSPNTVDYSKYES